MNAAILNYSRHIDSSVTAVETECSLLSLEQAYWLLSASIGINMTGLLLFLKMYRRMITNIGKQVST